MTVLDPSDIRAKRRDNPKMRERDFARIHRIPEAALVAAHVGDGVVRLNCDVSAVLNGLPALGEVMALTRNESAVHEKIGRYEGITVGAETALVLGEEIDLRIFPSRWKHAFAVSKRDEGGPLRHSLQFFDAAGEAVHKVHLREASDLVAFTALIERLAAAEQSETIPKVVVEPTQKIGSPAGRDELNRAWRALTDTHQFFGMLKRLNLDRLGALRMVDRDLAWPLAATGVEQGLRDAAAIELPIMAFVGNPGCIQIHSGAVQNIQLMGPWLNIFDETFHLHLRLDHITELWAVRKPTKDGFVTSVEAYGADRSLIIQFFGVRHEGVDELPAWRKLAQGLPKLEAVPA